jgi:hypothetical protein
VTIKVLLLFLHGIFRLKAPPESWLAVKLEYLGQYKRPGDLQAYSKIGKIFCIGGRCYIRRQSKLS